MRLVFSKFALIIGAISAPLASFAVVGASGFITFAANGSNYDYTINLTNTGTTTIGQLWYAWVPGQDYMAVQPTNISSALSWSSTVTGGFSGDGYAIRWTGGTAIPVGGSSTFKFTSSSKPSELAGNSVFYPNTPVGTSVVYDGALGTNTTIVIKPVPEPATVTALVAGIALMRKRRR